MKATVTQRDLQLLHHVARYRIATTDVLKDLFLANSSMDVLRSILKRLTKSGGVLRSRPLFDKKVYYQLTERGARFMDLNEEVAKPLGPQALPKCYGVLLFCAGAGDRRKLTRAEFQKLLSALWTEGLPFGDYYLKSEGENVSLHRIIIDLGGAPKRLVKKPQWMLSGYYAYPSALPLLDQKRIGFSVVTSSAEKEGRIMEEAAERRFPAPIETSVHPELVHLLPDFYED